MSAAHRAHFHLEQSVPQLHELLRKQVFTEAEIKAITKKRSDFEHLLAARGHTAGDYAAYAAYEINLGALVRKRAARRKVKLSGGTNDVARRVFYILERGVRKFGADLGLWMQLISYARKEKARKKVQDFMIRLLRMHPAKPEVWVYAAKAILDDEADMTAARGYLQRGLRFCKRSEELWLEYARLECIYIAKLAARRKILGMDGQAKKQKQNESEDMLMLPEITAEDINPALRQDEESDKVALEKLQNMPAMTGALPIAIFDAAMKEFNNQARLGQAFFETVLEFDRNPTFDRVLQHILEALEASNPDSVETITCQVAQVLYGIDTSSPEFPEALLSSLGIIRTAMKRSPLQKVDLGKAALVRLMPSATSADLDTDVQTALTASLKQFIKAVGSVDEVLAVVESLQKQKQADAAQGLIQLTLASMPNNPQLLAAQSAVEPSKQLVRVDG